MNNTLSTRVTCVLLAFSLSTSTPAVADSLHDAARDGDIDALQRLLAKGADVTLRSEGGTALMAAANAKTAALLIKAGADVNAKGEGGRTALLGAAYSNDPDL